MAVVYLDLPDLPSDLILEIKDVAEKIEYNEQQTQWTNQFFGYNTADFVYHTGPDSENSVEISKESIQKIKDIYGPLVGNVYPIIGRATNTTVDEQVSVGPHCDRARSVAINYIIELGGDNVITNMYKETRKDPSTLATQSENITDDELTIEKKYCFPKNKWLAFNTQQFHSVHNIKTTRLILSLFLTEDCKYEDFINKYNHLIIDNQQ